MRLFPKCDYIYSLTVVFFTPKVWYLYSVTVICLLPKCGTCLISIVMKVRKKKTQMNWTNTRENELGRNTAKKKNIVQGLSSIMFLQCLIFELVFSFVMVFFFRNAEKLPPEKKKAKVCNLSKYHGCRPHIIICKLYVFFFF